MVERYHLYSRSGITFMVKMMTFVVRITFMIKYFIYDIHHFTTMSRSPLQGTE